MTLRSLTAAALVAAGLGVVAAPALAQEGSRAVTVMGMTFEQPTGSAHAAHGHADGRAQVR